MSEVIKMLMEGAGVPILSVSVVGNVATVMYTPEATADEQQMGATIIANLDWNPKTSWYKHRSRAEALHELLHPNNACSLLMRALLRDTAPNINAMKIVMNRLVSMIVKGEADG